jgi:hypothetical protein
MRQVFDAIAFKLLGDDWVAPHGHDEVQTATGRNNITVDFHWDPFLKTSALPEKLLEQRNGTQKNLLIMGGGLHYAAWLPDSVKTFTDTMNALFPPAAMIPEMVKHSTYIMPVMPSDFPNLPDDKKPTMTKVKMDAMNDYLRLKFANLDQSYPVLWTYNEMVEAGTPIYDWTAIHVRKDVANIKADILLNHFCNPILAKEKKEVVPNASCCVPSTPRFTGQWIILVTGALVLLTTGSSLLFRIGDMTSSKESSGIVQAAFVFISVCMFCYLGDRTHSMHHLFKQNNEEQFVYLALAILLVFGIGFIRKSKVKTGSIQVNSSSPVQISQEILSRDQTDEWKGWMQALILLYHWTGTSQTLWIYQIIRLLVAAYLFMTGYGNTLYFLKLQDNRMYSIGAVVERAAVQLIRLNLLSVALSYTMGASYLSYYFAPLVSFWLVVSYACLSLKPIWNKNMCLLTVKVVLFGLFTTFLIRKEGILEAIFAMLENVCKMTVNTKEWRFRLGLDSIIIYVGILFAAAIEQIKTTNELQVQSSESVKEYLLEAKTTKRHDNSIIINDSNRSKWIKVLIPFGLASVSLAVMITWGYVARQNTSKQSYNALHPYLSPLPVLAFVVLRNCHPALQNRYSTAFARLGSCSLETFVLQFHLLLSNDTKGVISIPLLANVPRTAWIRMVELALVALPFLYLSEKAAKATQIIVGYFSENATAPAKKEEEGMQHLLSSSGDSNNSSDALHHVTVHIPLDEVNDDSPALRPTTSVPATSLPRYALSLARQHLSVRLALLMVGSIAFNWIGY